MNNKIKGFHPVKELSVFSRIKTDRFTESFLIFLIVVKEYQNYSEADESEDDSKKSRTHTPSVEDEEAKLPLGENILSHNIGIPLVVVCTKVRLRNNFILKQFAVYCCYTMIWVL